MSSALHTKWSWNICQFTKWLNYYFLLEVCIYKGEYFSDSLKNAVHDTQLIYAMNWFDYHLHHLVYFRGSNEHQTMIDPLILHA